ncbi:MAG: serine/threonine protein kinase bacterial [Planctomycetota bacterium]|nr:MAG: serine/threonine protein kinase bacterial [Planctomycetota bacterium]
MSDENDQDELGATMVNSAKVDEPKKEKRVFGDFELDKKLGQGGMGEVFLARQVSLDRHVALKLLSKEMAKKKGFVERFEREAKSMGKFIHPNAVQVFAYGVTNNQHYLAIEFIDGQSMQKWMDQLGKLVVGDAIHVILRCADALRVAHQDHNVIHRDIKPDNVLVTKKGVVKVADFGLAKAIGEGDEEEMSLTQSGTGLGTPLYMAPEQARDAKSADKRTDIYALGVTLYYFVTGKLPFGGDTVVKLIMAKEAGKYDSARKLNREVPEKLDMIIDKMIQKDKQHRYANCDELIHDLDALGLENSALSFLGGDATSARRTVASGGGASAKANMSAVMKTSADIALEKTEEAAAKDKAVWYVKHTNQKGQTVITKMQAAQIQQMVKAELLDLKATAKRGEKGEFLPLAQYPEFQDFMKKRLAKQSAQARGVNMKEMYAKIEKEQKRRKIFRWLHDKVEGTLGGIGFILYLAVIAAVLYGIYWAFPYARDFVASKFGLEPPKPPVVNPVGPNEPAPKSP